MIMTQLYGMALGQKQEKRGKLTVYRAAYQHLSEIQKTMTYIKKKKKKKKTQSKNKEMTLFYALFMPVESWKTHSFPRVAASLIIQRINIFLDYGL